jgi:hypothetical protein
LEKAFPLNVGVKRRIREFSVKKQKIGEPIAKYADDLMDLGIRANHKDYNDTSWRNCYQCIRKL